MKNQEIIEGLKARVPGISRIWIYQGLWGRRTVHVLREVPQEQRRDFALLGKDLKKVKKVFDVVGLSSTVMPAGNQSESQFLKPKYHHLATLSLKRKKD